MRNDHRQTLAQQSKDRIKNWTNTLEASRLKREEDRIKRLEDEEVSKFVITYKFRLQEELLTQRSKNTKTSFVDNKLRRQTVNYTIHKIWLKH